VDNIRIDIEEIDDRVDWIRLTQDRDKWRVLVIAIMNLWVP
jgi:hypothetical protein